MAKAKVVKLEVQADQPKKRKCKECLVLAVPVVNNRNQVRCVSCYHEFPSED